MKRTLRNTAWATSLSILTLSGCKQDLADGFLGSAVLDAETWQISPGVQGDILTMTFREGDRVTAGDLAALIDTIPFVLKLAELDALDAEATLAAQARNADVQGMQIRLTGAEREFRRADSLVRQGALPGKTRDDLETALLATRTQTEGAKSAERLARAKHRTLSAQRESLLDQLRRCRVLIPAEGVVTARYRNPGEQVGPGRPLLQIGRTDSLRADFFVPQPMLSDLKMGTIVFLRLDTPDGKGKMIPARITWIADEAEFTPRSVQTRETRNELVFRVRAMAANPDGRLKKGLPVEVWSKQ